MLMSLRIDKWLWAARFFKTRSLAKNAINSGKVHCDGQKLKPSREISRGVTLTIKQALDERTVEIIELCEQRRGAPQAILLYNETPESITNRKALSANRKAGLAGMIISEHKPNKKERRQIHQFIRQTPDE